MALNTNLFNNLIPMWAGFDPQLTTSIETELAQTLVFEIKQELDNRIIDELTLSVEKKRVKQLIENDDKI